MSPSTNIDGTEITGATIDGQDVQEITVDGDTVFTAIPDSVVVQFEGADYTQGNSTWPADAGPDMSITGDPQTETLSSGADGVRGDGVDDYGLWTPPASLQGSSLQAFSWEFSIQHTTSSVFEQGNYNGSGSTSVRCIFNESNAGDFECRIFDDSGAAIRFRPSTNPNLDDGNTHKISLIVNDASANDCEIIIDGSSVSVSFPRSDGPSNFGTQLDQAVWGRNNQGSVDSYGNVGHGIMRWHDSAITGQTI